MKIRMSVIAGILALSLSLAACGSPAATPSSGTPAATPAAQQPAEQKPSIPIPEWWLGDDAEYIDMVQKAQAEGTVVWRSAPDPNEKIDSLFTKEYGIKVDHEEIHSAELLAKVSQEAAAGRKTADVLGINPEHIGPLLELDLIQQVDWSKAQAVRDSSSPKDLVVGDNLGILSITWFRDLLYNKDLVKPEDLPKTYEDLLDPKWADGKIAIDNDLTNFIVLAQPHMWGVEKTEAYLKELAKQKPKIHPNAGLVAEWASTGETLLALNTHMNNTYKYPNLGFVALKPAVPVVWTSWLIPKTAEHPNAAKLFLYWIMHSREFWEAMYDAEIPRVNAYLPVDRDLFEKYLPKSEEPLVSTSLEWGLEVAEKKIVDRLQRAVGAK